ncbi:hypothetical protein [Taibaiella helva]|uniref:hypothetical protein n=1 Tax=Taibaiella helva TaxID=2301235 RepID=UPI001300BD11|nr:hypothetical protein [Taibaiella helva]
MDNSFDRLLKEKLADQSPEALGFRPDREKLWQQMEAKKKRQTRLIPLWLSHTAAVAAGLLIAFFFLPHKGNNTKESAPAVAGRQTVIRTDTVFVLQAATATGPGMPTTTIPQHHNRAAAAAPIITSKPEAPTANIPVPEAKEEKLEAPIEAPVVAAAPPQTPRVLHLADMDNENAATPQQKKELGGFLPANLTLPDGRENALSSTAVQLFTKSKN